MSQKRLDQSTEIIRHQLSELLSRELELPADGLVTITRVELSPDRRYVTVWIVASPTNAVGEIYGILRGATRHLRHLLGQQLDWQFVPQLRWRIDHSGMAVAEVESLLEVIARERAEHPLPTDGNQVNADNTTGL